MAAGTDDATDATTKVVRAYSDRLERGELDAPLQAYAPHGRITIHGVLEEATRERLAECFAAFNARTRAARRLGGTAAREIADGVWVVRGGFPLRTMNVYLVRDTQSASRSGTGAGGVLAFDAGIEAMAGAILHAAAPLGGLTRVVLGHGHVDHRGAAPRLGVPVLCHPDERADAEGDAGVHYMHLERLRPHMRVLYAKVLFGLWDGGPVAIADTVDEGDEVAGFRVVHLPGHAPGLIALWREADRLALASDAFYTIDPQTLRKGGPRVAHAAFNLDTEQARASMRKLAALEPATVWSGHADPVTGDVGRELERAAATT